MTDKYQVQVDPAALDEISDAYQEYRSYRDNLGDEFLVAISAAMDILERTPFIYAKVEGSVRRQLLGRFPFGLFYVIDEEFVTILSCYPTRADPRRRPKRP